MTMVKATLNIPSNRLSDAAINASRQMWLASLGAAVVTRDWVQSEAGDVFKTLVKEGTVIESRAIRFVGDRIETSVSLANSVWKEARKTVESTVKQAADTAVSLAQQVLPKSLPTFDLPMVAKAMKPAKPAKRSIKAAKPAKRSIKAAKPAKRSIKAAKPAKRSIKAAKPKARVTKTAKKAKRTKRA
jgi:hypothetical protein